MEIQAFVALMLPFIIIVYLAFLLFLRPPRPVLLASLLAGLLMGLINILFDLLAYYAHWWHYTLNGLILHVPILFYISFYITPILIYGSIVFLLIWRFWNGRGHWFALLLLSATPFFKAGTDILGALVSTPATQILTACWPRSRTWPCGSLCSTPASSSLSSC